MNIMNNVDKQIEPICILKITYPLKCKAIIREAPG